MNFKDGFCPKYYKISCGIFAIILFLQENTFSKCSPVNDRPIIGILAGTSLRRYKPYADSYIFTTYVRWAESGGSRVVPILLNQTDTYYEKIFNSINGAIFPGGIDNLTTSPYRREASFIFTQAIEANDKGDYFPIFGMCLGLQELTALVSGEDLMAFHLSTESLPLNLSQDYQQSRLFGRLPPEVKGPLTKENITTNYHEFGLSPENFTTNKKLQQFFRILSTNLDVDGNEFISTLEAINYPFYGTQWHPEKNSYKWSVSQNISHTYSAVRAMQYFADFFVNECRKNFHTFPDLQTELDHMIDNFPVQILKNENMEIFYAFNSSENTFYEYGEAEYNFTENVSFNTMDL